MKRIPKLKKSQIFSADITIAIAAFIVILIASMWIWDYSREKIDLAEKRNDLELISRIALASLVETSGDPSNWTNFEEADFNKTNVYSLGLARSYSNNNLDIESKGKSAGLTTNNYLILDEDKIQRLNDLNAEKYNTIKRILGILGPEYEFQLIIKEWNGASYQTQYEIGSAPSLTASDIIRADRYALLNGNWANVIIKIWQECSGVTC